MAREPWKPSKSERRDHYRSISQSTRESRAIQGEVPWDAYIHPYRRPGYYVRRGVTPPQWMGGEVSVENDSTCPVCGEPADCRTRIDGVIYYHHDHEPRTAPDMGSACREEAA